jgi:hypothetical protein
MNKYNIMMDKFQNIANAKNKSISEVMKDTFLDESQVKFVEILLDADITFLTNDNTNDKSNIVWLKSLREALSNFRNGASVTDKDSNLWVMSMSKLNTHTENNFVDRLHLSYYQNNGNKFTIKYNDDGVLVPTITPIAALVANPVWYIDKSTPLDKYLMVAKFIYEQFSILPNVSTTDLMVMIDKIEIIKRLIKTQKNIKGIRVVRVLTSSKETDDINNYKRNAKRVRKVCDDGVIEYNCSEGDV